MPRTKRKTREDQGIVYSCNAYLDQRWQEITRQFELAAPGEPEDPLGEDHGLILSIRQSLRGQALTYHYVLPTQLLAKCVDPSLDVHSLQAGYDVVGSFDARTIAHDVIVPFDRANQRVLGGSPEPYVNNPLRVQAVTAEYRSAQKHKDEWDQLVVVLDAVQAANDETFTRRIFDQVLFEICRMLSGVTVTYPTPNRISLKRTYEIVMEYLRVKSGGDRMEAVCTALFRTIGSRFGLFDQVRRERVNVADAPAGMWADIECWLNNKLVLLVEVKDRTLTLIAVDTKLDVARSQHISEILFIAEQGKEPNDVEGIDERIANEFVSGQNIYVTNFADFSLGIFILFGEAGRVEFLGEVGRELDRAASRIEHRKAWADLLKQA